MLLAVNEAEPRAVGEMDSVLISEGDRLVGQLDELDLLREYDV